MSKSVMWLIWVMLLLAHGTYWAMQLLSWNFIFS